MSCLLTDADKASLNPIYYKVEKQLSKGFHFRYRISSVQISLNAFVGENAAFQNSLSCSVLLTSFFVFTPAKNSMLNEAEQPQNLRLYSCWSISQSKALLIALCTSLKSRSVIHEPLLK